jgi:hypothetical protein
MPLLNESGIENVESLLQPKKEEAKYAFPDLGRGDLKMTKSDLLLLLALESYGPMSMEAFHLKCERLYNFEAFIQPFFPIPEKERKGRECRWFIEPRKSIVDLAMRFERMLEEGHAPMMRFPNKCPDCQEGRLEKTFREGLPTWTCSKCRGVFSIEGRFLKLKYDDEAGPRS